MNIRAPFQGGEPEYGPVHLPPGPWTTLLIIASIILWLPIVGFLIYAFRHAL